MLQCAHVVSADTPGISRPARVRFVQRGNRRCDTAPSISCHVPSKRRSTEGPSLGPDYTVVQCYCHCREQLTGTQGRLLQVCSCNTDNGSASGAAHFRTFVRAMFSGILFKGLLFEARQLHTRFKYLCSLHYTTHTQTHTIHTAMSESATLTCHIQRDVQNAWAASTMVRICISMPSSLWGQGYVPPGLALKKFLVLPTQLYLCVLCESQNKQRLFPYTTLTDWFV